MAIEADSITQGLAQKYWKRTSNLKSKQKISIKHLKKLLMEITYLKHITLRQIFVEVWKCISAKKEAIGKVHFQGHGESENGLNKLRLSSKRNKGN